MPISRRVFVSLPNPDRLDPRRLALQEAILAQVRAKGFEIEAFMLHGAASRRGWTVDAVAEVMRSCVGAVIIAFPRWQRVADAGPLTAIPGTVPIASEFAQVEGAIARALGLPTLFAVEVGLADRGALAPQGGQVLLFVPQDADTTFLATAPFARRFDAWAAELSERRDVFLGYSSSARSTAQAVNLFLSARLGVRVLDWSLDFAAGGMILDEIAVAASRCTGGIFLFTQDDALEGSPHRAAPRDNVVFEAGYFAAARGHERVLVIRESGAKMPADLGGNIYLELKDRHDIAPIESAIRDFVERRL